jgi:hypothetical protein
MNSYAAAAEARGIHGGVTGATIKTLRVKPSVRAKCSQLHASIPAAH